MGQKDFIVMSVKELERHRVIEDAAGKKISHKHAALRLDISTRQVRRLVKRFRKEGVKGLLHKRRNAVSNRKLPEEVKSVVLNLYGERYPDFGPALFSEKLFELHNINISKETAGKWLMEEGLWKRKRKVKIKRRLRERKPCFGEMLQLDGSSHHWFEKRGNKAVLMALIDDASGFVCARFFTYEGTIPAMSLLRDYMGAYGLPMSIYSDRHTTYKSPDEYALSQFGRAMEELGIELIHARSPQAKGRVERLFRTLQDRLVKELRLKNISDIGSANDFLNEYLESFNNKFNVVPLNAEDAHVRLPDNFDYGRYLCIKEERKVKNDNTVSYNGRLYQLGPKAAAVRVTMEGHMDGSLKISHDGKYLEYAEIKEKPAKKHTADREINYGLNRYIPPRSHPWKEALYNKRINRENYLAGLKQGASPP